LSGKHNAFLCSKLIGALSIKEHGIAGLTAGPIIPGYKRIFSFAVKKGDTELLEKLNQGLLIIKTSGEYERIYDKWLSFDDPWQKARKYFLPAIIAVIVIAVIAGIWLVVIQRLVRKRTRELAKTNKMLSLAYDNMEARIQERTADLEQANQLLQAEITERRQREEFQVFLAQTSTRAGDETFFEKLARFLAHSLGMDFVCIDRLEGDGLTARTVAIWHDGKFKDNVSYALKDTPCGDVVGQVVCCFPARVRHLFPHDQVLQYLMAESYVGVTLWSRTGQPIGLIAVIGHSPLVNRKLAEAMLKMVAARAVGELERLDAEEALNASLREKEMLLREIYHRTKNNMQVIMSLLNLQFGRIEDAKVQEIFRETTDRVKSMAMVHERLYQAKDLSRIDIKDYTEELAGMIVKSNPRRPGSISLHMDLESVALTIDSAIPYGLVLNELLSNVMKHAFPGEREGEIRVLLRRSDDGEIEIGVEDNGVGLPEGLDIRQCDSLGLELVVQLTEYQLRGQVEVRREKGTQFRIRFRESERRERI